MHSADLQLLWEYNTWANGKIFAAAAGLRPEQLREAAHSGHGTLFATLIHLYDTEYGWRMLAQHGQQTPEITEKEILTLSDLMARSLAEAAAMANFIGGLSDADTSRLLHYNVGHELRERVLWHVLYHVANHGSYHRGECAATLSALGRSPGELDFTIFLRERQI
jgi:uncharacterized damage-inducible protein DinB